MEVIAAVATNQPLESYEEAGRHLAPGSSEKMPLKHICGEQTAAGGRDALWACGRGHGGGVLMTAAIGISPSLPGSKMCS